MLSESKDTLVHHLVQSAPEVMRPLVDYWYIDEDGNYYYEYEPDYYEWDDYYDPYDSDDTFEYEDLTEGLPHYDQDDLDGADYIDYIDYYRYMINLVFVALPWAVVSAACVGWNLYFNANWNEMWAGGNVWLMANTFYILFQGFASIMLAFELPIWLRTFRTTRFWSFVFATVYNLVFFTLALEWWDMLYVVNDKSSYDFVDIFINMCLGYNIVLHFTIIPVNTFIIVKEISMEYF